MRELKEPLTLKLEFNPEKLEYGSELYWLFKLGGIGLKFWFLWKRSHLTTRGFNRTCLELHELCTGHVKDNYVLKAVGESTYWCPGFEEVLWQEGDEITYNLEDQPPARMDYDFVAFLKYFWECRQRVQHLHLLSDYMGSGNNNKWFIDSWDYLNPVVQKAMYYQYTRENGVTCKVRVLDSALYMKKPRKHPREGES